MKRWMAVAAVAVMGLIGSAGSAAAQFPGGNGFKASTYDGDETIWPACFTPPPGSPWDAQGYYLPSGGASFNPAGTLIAAVIDGGPTPATIVVGGVGAPCVQPRELGPADERSTLSFSPDGKNLAITRGGDVVVVSATTGATIRNLTPNLPTTTEKDPTWSPKGTLIAYVSAEGLRTRPAAGGSSTLRVKGVVARPDFSPDGTRIAYLNASHKIAYLTLSTGKVTTTPITADSVVWSPDGNYFLFGTTETSHGCVVAKLTGKIVSRPVPDATVCTALAWQPTH